jgi:CubicO group peptidase (beta-lactamase class C family)
MRNHLPRPLSLVLALALAFVSLPGGAYAGFDSATAQAVIRELGAKAAADPAVPGLAIAVLQKGEDEPVTAAFGAACVENATPMSTQTRFKVGSVTKVFTAALIHRFIEQGKLAPDTAIDRFFPGFPGGGGITVRNLLEHTSGIVDMLNLPAVRADMTRSWPADEILAMAAKEPLQFQPGTRQAYSNTGFLMLAVICERISGRSYEDLVRGMFVEKLGMKSLLVGNDKDVAPRLACGYARTPEGGLGRPMKASLAMAKGTGNLEAAPADVVRLVNLDRVLKDDFLANAPHAPLSLADGRQALVASKRGAYSMGELDGCTLFLFHSPAMALVGKPGSFPGFGAIYLYDRQTRTAVAISVNNESAVGRIIDLAAEILAALRGKDVARP